MKKEIPPALIIGALVLVVVVIGAIFIVSMSSSGLTGDQARSLENLKKAKEWERTQGIRSRGQPAANPPGQ